MTPCDLRISAGFLWRLFSAANPSCGGDIGAFCLLSNVSPVRSSDTFGFTPSELRQLRAMKTPAGVQKFLDDLPYNLSFTARSPKKSCAIAPRHVLKAEFLAPLRFAFLDFHH